MRKNETDFNLSALNYSIELFKPYPAKLIYSNIHPLEVASRYRDPQLQVGEIYSYLFNL